MPQCKVLVVAPSRQTEFVERFQTDVDVPVLKELVVEILLCEIGVQGDKGTVLLSRVGKRALICGVLRSILLYLLLCDVVVLFRRLCPAEHILDVGAVQVRLGEIRVQFDGLVVVVKGVEPPFHPDKIRGAVVVGQNVLRIDVDDMVHVRESLLHVPDLSVDETPVVKGKGIARLIPQHTVQVFHRGVVVVLVVVHQGPVEIGESVGRVKADRLVHVRDGILVVLSQGIDTATADVTFRIEPVQLDGSVVVFKSLCRVIQEKIGSSSVQVGGRVFRILSDVTVKIVHRLVELLGEKVSHAPAEIETVKARPKFHGLFKILESLVIFSETAEGDGPEMVAVGEDRIEAHRSVEIRLRSTQVAEIVLGDPSIEKSPAVSRVQTRQNIEMTDGFRIFSVRKGSAASEIEHILVVLRIGHKRAAQ